MDNFIITPTKREESLDFVNFESQLSSDQLAAKMLVIKIKSKTSKLLLSELISLSSSRPPHEKQSQYALKTFLKKSPLGKMLFVIDPLAQQMVHFMGRWIISQGGCGWGGNYAMLTVPAHRWCGMSRAGERGRGVIRDREITS